MYGLFEVTYDLYRWDDLSCCSKDINKLIDRAKGTNSQLDNNHPIFIENDYESEYGLTNYNLQYCLDNEINHWLIAEIEII